MGLKRAGAVLGMKGGILNRTVHVGAKSSASAELSGNAYARIAAALAAWTRAATGISQNTAGLTFPTPTGDYSSAATRAALYSAATGGDELWDEALVAVKAAPKANAVFRFPAEMVKVSLVGGAITAAGSKAAQEEGLVSGNRWLTLHTSAPGTTGANQAGDAIALPANGTIFSDHPSPGSGKYSVRNNTLISTGVLMSDLADTTHVALRDAANSGNVLWTDAYDNDPSDPEVGDTFTFPANMLTIGFDID